MTDLWVLKNSTEVQRVQKKKKIYENVKIVKKANVEKINSVDWKLLSNNVLNLSASESLLKNVTFKTINCKKYVKLIFQLFISLKQFFFNQKIISE